jgi:predicted Fe-S protein YdhL (DUF1289 family)
VGREPDVAHGVRQPGKRLRSDHAFRSEVALCTDTLHIPHSHFLGGPNTWTDLDRAKVRAYLAWKSEVCSGCGTHAAEWDPRRGGDRNAYIADLTYCPGCSRLHESREQEVDDEARARGVHQVLVPADVYKRRMAEAEERNDG